VSNLSISAQHIYNGCFITHLADHSALSIWRCLIIEAIISQIRDVSVCEHELLLAARLTDTLYAAESGAAICTLFSTGHRRTGKGGRADGRDIGFPLSEHRVRSFMRALEARYPIINLASTFNYAVKTSRGLIIGWSRHHRRDSHYSRLGLTFLLFQLVGKQRSLHERRSFASDAALLGTR